MKIIKQWSQKLHFRKLQQEVLKKRQKQKLVNFNNAQLIGLLLDATDPVHIDAIRKFIKTLEKNTKTVKTLVYYNDKLEHASSAFPYFCKKDLNWIGVPGGYAVDHFLQQDFDLVFNLSLVPNQALDYITALSTAGLKLGSYREEDYYFDVMLDNSKKQDLSSFIEQIQHYLKRINTPRHETSAV